MVLELFRKTGEGGRFCPSQRGAGYACAIDRGQNWVLTCYTNYCALFYTFTVGKFLKQRYVLLCETTSSFKLRSRFLACISCVWNMMFGQALHEPPAVRTACPVSLYCLTVQQWPDGWQWGPGGGTFETHLLGFCRARRHSSQCLCDAVNLHFRSFTLLFLFHHLMPMPRTAI